MVSHRERRCKTTKSRHNEEDAGKCRYTTDRGEEHDEGDNFLGDTVKTVFGQCVGFVDVASFVIHSCRGERNDANRNNDILSPLFKTNYPETAKREQGETLEFLADGGFQDDVSALSANTLEEMEKITRRMAAHNTRSQPTHDPFQHFPGQQLIPPSRASQNFTKKRTPAPAAVTASWNLSIPGEPSATEMSLGVATSTSSSTPEGLQSHERDWHRTQGPPFFKARPGL